MADKLQVSPTLPGTAKRQQHYRNNVEARTPEEYYRRALAIPMLDIISEMELRFSKFMTSSSIVLSLVPSIVAVNGIHKQNHDLIANYKDSILNPDLVDFEIAMWQRK